MNCCISVIHETEYHIKTGEGGTNTGPSPIYIYSVMNNVGK
jgi:hypothetical protein